MAKVYNNYNTSKINNVMIKYKKCVDNGPAIVWEIPHFGIFPAFLRERPVFLA